MRCVTWDDGYIKDGEFSYSSSVLTIHDGDGDGFDQVRKKSSSKTKQGDKRYTSIDVDKIITKNKKIINNQTMSRCRYYRNKRITLFSKKNRPIWKCVRQMYQTSWSSTHILSVCWSHWRAYKLHQGTLALEKMVDSKSLVSPFQYFILNASCRCLQNLPI